MTAMAPLGHRRRIVAAGVVLLAAAALGSSTAASAADPSSSVSITTTAVRDHLVDGADTVVDTRKITVTVSQTTDLRDRQGVTVTWSGAHPTGGLVTDRNSAAAALQEYPVVVMQCRGVDSTSAPVAQRVSPQTCWTQTPDERFQYSQSGFLFPPYRMDRYASTEDRNAAVGQPDPLPAACSPVPVPHWIPFVAADGTVYPGGNLGCAGLAPEAANAADSLQPGNTTYGAADSRGNGSTKFIMQSSETNASVGCSAVVTCSLVIVPIMGISCDAAGVAADAPDRGMPATKRPPASLVPTIFAECSKTGHFAPGSQNGGGETPDLAVSGQLWWAASNWRNRISVPITFAQSASVCNVVNNSATIYLYGSQSMAQATQQWQPHFCLDKTLYTLRHVQTSEPQAKNLLNAGLIDGALQGVPPSSPFAKPTVQAPVAVSGFAIAYSIDGRDGNPYPNLKLNARLLAKLLSESYRSCALDCLDYTSEESQKSGFAKLATNPIDMSRDPEFQALNPGIPATNYLEPAASLAAMSSDSDVMHALTSYIDADPEARAWLDGQPDPWGMVVNPAYKGIELPVDSFPLLDTHLRSFSAGANQCLTADPVPWLPLVAAPVSNPAIVALNMQFDIANSQVNCQNNGAQNQKLVALGREVPGQRFLVGLVSLADAARYQLNAATLQTHNSGGTGKFTDTAGRSFVGPTTAALAASTGFLKPDDTLGSWVMDYAGMATSSSGAGAYPGTMLLSADIATTGLPAADAGRYATFLRFAVGAGQKAGLGVGQLPPGYLPLTGAQGLGTFVTYTQLAADAVQQQRGYVPVPSKPMPPATPAPSPSASSPAGGGASLPAAGDGGLGAGGQTSADSGAPPARTTTSAPANKPTPSSSAAAGPVVRAEPVARTSSIESGPLGLALPVLVLLGVLSLGTAAWLSGVGRR